MNLLRKTYVMLAVLIAAAGGAARAMDGSPNDVAILQCHIEWSTVVQGNDTDDFLQEVRGIRVVFQNNGSTDLTHVKFAVGQDGQRVVLDAFGRFSPGVPIEHYFDARELSFDEPVCSVVATP